MLGLLLRTLLSETVLRSVSLLEKERRYDEVPFVYYAASVCDEVDHESHVNNLFALRGHRLEDA